MNNLENNKKTVTLKVNGIHCGGCATKIIKSLDTLNMDQTTDINVETGAVKISYNADKASLSQIKTKITEVGYQVESVELE
ncbi:MAG: heavy-metal-associated domain-containing protein [Bacteriovorax sp.]|nr:heavy-metal-associated domain-containing protein [Bacteriovorax sp.]